ncbi:MAG TPA: hypothetical protein VJS68_04265 [Thermoplasmata archaeon]|nr:hypothetical protein [Thermoplasmata archaeon]
MTYETLRICSGGGGFEAVPRPRVATDLLRLRQLLEENAVSVIDARVMLIFRWREEVTVARDGRVLIKSPDQQEASSIWSEIEPLLNRVQTTSA